MFQGVATRFLEAGAIVVAPSLDENGLKDLQNNLGSPAGLFTVHGTFSNTEQANELVRIVKSEVGRLDMVVAHGGLDGVCVLTARHTCIYSYTQHKHTHTQEGQPGCRGDCIVIEKSFCSRYDI